jgi:APA family basic amino acid/polyamine antiporter
MRKIYPDVERPFRVPGSPVVPLLGVACCLVFMLSLPWENWWRLIVWMVIGLLIYALYGRKHSIMAAEHTARELAAHGAGGAYVEGGPERP